MKLATERFHEAGRLLTTVVEETKKRRLEGETKVRTKKLHLDLCEDIKKLPEWDKTVLTLAKRAVPPNVVAGKDTEVTYTIKADYIGSATLIGVTVTDPDCAPLTPSGAPPEYTSEAKLNSGGSLTLTCKKKINSTIVNNATIKAQLGPGGANIERTASATVTATPPSPDNDAPALAVTSHKDGVHVKAPDIMLTGTASDAGTGDNGIWMVHVNNGVVSKVDPLVANGGGTANWNKSFYLSPGENRITVEAYDNSRNYNKATVTLSIYYDAPEPVEQKLVLSPGETEIKVGETAAFTAKLIGTDKSTKDVTSDADIRWFDGPTFKAEKEGTFTVSAIYNRMVASASVTVAPVNKPPPDLTRRIIPSAQSTTSREDRAGKLMAAMDRVAPSSRTRIPEPASSSARALARASYQAMSSRDGESGGAMLQLFARDSQ